MIIKPWQSLGELRARAYPLVTDLSTLASECKRKRKVFHFIATVDAIRNHPIDCPVCKKAIEPAESNRGEFHPKYNDFVVMHYECAWSAIFAEMFRQHDRGLI